MKVRFENDPGRYIELRSCKIREFGKVYHQAMGFLLAQTEEEMVGIVSEILESWVPDLDADDLTMEDVWNILLAKAGKSKREAMEGMPKTAAEAVANFLKTSATQELMVSAMEEAMREALPVPQTSPGEDQSLK